MKISIIFFSLIISSFPMMMKAQSDTIITRVITFDDGDFNKESARDKYYRNVVKINPLMLVHGDIPIYYERTLNSKFSLEVGVGISSRDYWNMLRDHNTYDDFDADRIQEVSFPSFKLGGRYYPEGYAPEEWYLAMEYSFRAHEQKINTLDNDGDITNQTVSAESTINEYKVIFGGQGPIGYSNNFFWDTYIGVGVRIRDYTYVEENQVSIGSESIYDYDFIHDTSLVPAFYLGFKMGIAF